MKNNAYEMVIGLEVHVELKTKTKIFCSCPTTFGAEPNTQVCPVCMGMPGTLPVLNRTVVEYAVKAGLATNCEIARYSKMDRKNYFYPDLPKAYQISQYDKPLCEHGSIEIEGEWGKKSIGITRIHIEEDAGKLVHDDEHGTMIDCNRCGVPLIEIVSEPDIRSAAEAAAYVKKLRAIMLYCGVSDCRMQEGSLRCDVNLSVRKKGEEKFGTRTEMKNLNSMRFIERAIEYEFARQVEEIESGGTIVQETRRFDEASGKTYSMRRKENANDYRYFPDPDLTPILLTDEEIDAIGASIPMLPDQRKAMYTEKWGISPADAEILIAEPSLASFFEKGAQTTDHPKILSNLFCSELLRLFSGDEDFSADEEKALSLASVAQMAGDKKINASTAKKLVADVWSKGIDPVKEVAEKGLEQITDRTLLAKYVEEAIAANPKSAEDFKKGKAAAAGAIVGAVMAKTGGRADAAMVSELTRAALTEK